MSEQQEKKFHAKSQRAKTQRVARWCDGLVGLKENKNKDFAMIQKENIVYILGAGFSAPLGIPVMSNFLQRGQEMYFAERNKYPFFKDIFELISKLHTIKTFMNVDLLNIEEILSILEMGYHLGDNEKDLDNYKAFISIVVETFTPVLRLGYNDKEMKEYFKFNDGKPKTEWFSKYFGRYTNYAAFMANLFKVTPYLHININKMCIYPQLENRNINYSIITLNYDKVIENIVDNFEINGYEINYDKTKKALLINPWGNSEKDEYYSEIPFYKLHGSVDGKIKLPSWNKSIDKDIQPTWKGAFEQLKKATQIRILGYSLPVSDNYLKYLLAYSAKREGEIPLKNIDVITRDGDGKTKKRYDELFCYNKFRFKDISLEKYFEALYSNPDVFDTDGEKIKFGFETEKVEGRHHKFMNA